MVEKVTTEKLDAERLDENIEEFFKSFKKLCKRQNGKVRESTVPAGLFEEELERWITCRFDTPKYLSIDVTQRAEFEWVLNLCLGKDRTIYNCIDLNLKGVIAISPHRPLLNRLSVSYLTFRGRDTSSIELEFTEKDGVKEIRMRAPIGGRATLFIHPVTAQYY